MGSAIYGMDDVMTINTTVITRIHNNDFLTPWEGDPKPEPPINFWGIDTSNIAAIIETHGLAYGYEIWRGAGKDIPQGNAVAPITFGRDKPIATRLGPLLTVPKAI